MALLVERIEQNDIFYIRVFCSVDPMGQRLRIHKLAFLDKEEYKRRNVADIPELPKYVVSDYNREQDGPDLLMIAHQKLIEYLCSEHTTIRWEEDPSTAEMIQVEEFTPRFCLPGEISIVDLS